MAKKAEVTKEQCFELIDEEIGLISSEDDRTYGEFDLKEEKSILVPIPSTLFMDNMRMLIDNKWSIVPGTGLLKELQDYAAAKARNKPTKTKVFVRYRRTRKFIDIDRADLWGTAVRINAEGIKILNKPKTLFYRPKGQLPLVEHAECGIKKGFMKLRKYVGKISPKQYRLLISWMVAVICTDGPYPILLLQGEQGSAKTFTMRIIRSLIDPVISPIRSLPQNERDFIIMASHSVVLPFDNVSHLKSWMPDAFCRVASGGGYSARKLYTDDEEMVFILCRPFMMNGIPDFITKNDMADRVILIMMLSIPEEDRKTESELWSAFEKDKPEILGALYEAVRTAMANIKDIEIEKLPRMADFAKIACAVAPGLDWTQQDFLDANDENIQLMSATCLDADEVATAVLEFAMNHGEWKGAVSILLAELSSDNMERSKKRYWPTTASNLSSRLRVAAPGLRGNGVEITFSRTAKNRNIMLKYVGNNSR